MPRKVVGTLVFCSQCIWMKSDNGDYPGEFAKCLHPNARYKTYNFFQQNERVMYCQNKNKDNQCRDFSMKIQERQLPKPWWRFW